MGASSQDINLIIISNEQTAYYSSVKGCGNLIWDIRFGLFKDEKPDAFKILEFTKNTDWENCIVVLDKPLENPIYGSIIINFDKKEIIDNNGYGLSNTMSLTWLIYSTYDALENKEGLIPKKSLENHLKNNRITFIDYKGNLIGESLPKTFKEFKLFLDNLGFEHRYALSIKAIEKSYHTVALKIPQDWTHYPEEKSN